MFFLMPPFLYKILSLENWESSDGQILLLPKEDQLFIHFSTEEQLEGIVTKYWSQVNHYVILKIDSSQLPGKMVLEANPGGSTLYYHLYEGSIPKESIVEIKRIG